MAPPDLAKKLDELIDQDGNLIRGSEGPSTTAQVTAGPLTTDQVVQSAHLHDIDWSMLGLAPRPYFMSENGAPSGKKLLKSDILTGRTWKAA